MKNTIIWDMDGTILNTLDDLADSVNYALEACEIKPHSQDEIKAMLGNGIKVLMELAVPQGFNNPKFDKCFEIFKQHYQVHMNDKTKPYPEIPELMKILRQKGYKQAIVSNKIDVAVKKLAQTYYPFVDLAIGECEGLQRKPQPDMVFKALEDLGANKQEAVYIGDSEVDLQTAKNSGLDCISVAWGFRTTEMLQSIGAKKIVQKPMQILDALAEM